MKLKRLLKRVESFINAAERERRAARDEMRKVLDKLKRKERKLKQQLEQARDTEERAALESKIAVVHAQRKKGVDALKAAKRAREKPGKGRQQAAVAAE